MVPDEKMGEFTLRFRKSESGFSGLAFSTDSRSEVMHAATQPALRAKLANYVGKVHPNYFGWDEAMLRFNKLFPEGFKSAPYLDAERNYKLAAKNVLAERLPLDEVFDRTGMGEDALAVFRKTNLLSPFEKTRVQELLRGPASDDFVRGAAMFANGDVEGGISKMHRSAEAYDVAKWTVLTYLPFFWKPDEHMFLKPEVTKDCSERVGHVFHHVYETSLNLRVYSALLDLVKTAKAELSAYECEDNIDIQSFIWIVGKY